MFHGVKIQEGKTEVVSREQFGEVQNQLYLAEQDWDAKRFGIYDDEANKVYYPVTDDLNENLEVLRKALRLNPEHQFTEILPTS